MRPLERTENLQGQIDDEKEKFMMKRSSLMPAAVTLLALVGTSLYCQNPSQNQAPLPARSRADEMVDRWNYIGNKLVMRHRHLDALSWQAFRHCIRPHLDRLPVFVGY